MCVIRTTAMSYVLQIFTGRVMCKFYMFVAALLLAVQPLAAQVGQSAISSEIVRIADRDYYLHSVAQGETVFSLTRLYGISHQQFLDDNPDVRENGLKAGQTVKILCADVPEPAMSRRKLQRTFITHTVTQGQTAYSIAKQYSISLTALIQDNPGLDPVQLHPGQELRIRKSEIDKSSSEQILSQLDNFASSLSDVSPDFSYHPVEAGQTLYSISKHYGVDIDDIRAVNNLENGLQAGTLLKIPVHGNQTPETTLDAESSAGGGIMLADTLVAPRIRMNNGVLNLSILLPLSDKGKNRNEFVEFYNGALIAAEQLKHSGISMHINLFDTQHSSETVAEITASQPFQNSDLIIGPVYEDELAPVINFSRQTGVPIVSPLAAVNGNYGQSLFRLSPDPESKYLKLKQLVSSAKQIIFVTSDVTDKEFEREMLALVGNIPYHKIVYNKNTNAQQIDRLISGADSETLFIVVAGNESGVDLILAALSSVKNSRLGRSIRTGRMDVIGNSKWLRFRNVDRNLFFKLNVSFVTSYHADRGNSAVRDFDNRYIAAFGRIPTLYSYRGYDAVMIFASQSLARYQNLNALFDSQFVPLQTPYNFVVKPDGNIANLGWALVSYSDDYSISVK